MFQQYLGIFAVALLVLPMSLVQAYPKQLNKTPLFDKAIPEQVELDNLDQVESKMTMQWGLVFIEGKINGQGPFRFLLDTGADTSILSYEIIQKLNLTPQKTNKQTFKTGNRVAVINTAHYQIQDLKIGRATFRNVPFLASNTASDDFQLLKDLNILGILGANLFHDVVLTLDLPNGKIKMSKAELFAKEHHGKLFKPGNIITLSERYYLPVVKMAVLAKETQSEYDFLVDTGYNGFVKMPICFAEVEKGKNEKIVDYDIFNEPGTGFQSELRGSLVLGEKKIENPMVKYTLGDCREEKNWGLIGTRYLQYQTVSIDQQQRLVYLHG
jgi:predicted aspartyl protease